jgi:bis(5'-nucleosyl)-tetraphosphatase (symmetrical)
LQQLLHDLHFSDERDQLFFVGDLVNRGPQSLQVLRLLRAIGPAAQTVLGNHDLHLLALHHDPQRKPRASDTLDNVLEAGDREALLDWLIELPLLIDDAAHGDLFVHAGLVPDWSVQLATDSARAAEAALRAAPGAFLAGMYGNKPDCWSDAHTATEQYRFTINVLTRLRYCRADGRIDLKRKEAPARDDSPWRPWFEHVPHARRNRRIVFGHWSTLGLVQRRDLLALDTGCVWGGALTAVNLDDPEAPPVQVRCSACAQPGSE